MGRVTYGAARHRKKVRILRKARGFRGARSKRWRTAKEAVVRADATAYRDRRKRKRDFRKLWVIRLSAACRSRGILYSRFIFGLNEADITLNRKMLSEIAIHSPADFDAVVEIAKKNIPAAAEAA
ncbi:MAG: 50S ribosomal protein L20 [Phycisphaerales bacterium]|nr:MAG: 50S ribosomal protein L20 [Phycisphaerales bacterium]